MKRFLICLSVFVLAFAVFAFPASAYTDSEDLNYDVIGVLEKSYPETAFSYEYSIDNGYYYVRNISSSKMYAYLDLPSTYPNCKGLSR